MWVFKPFAQKERTGLEGRYIDVGNLKIHVLNAIAEGGFSCVYLARDTQNMSKQYAMKHIICNDGESLELVMKEIAVMKSLKGHPNVVTLYAHTIMDMGRTKEALLVMEYCAKSLVHVLEARGSGYFEEKQILSIFRDVCNAVFAMHCQSPPIAHRDLKAENLLLGPDGLWKLCDFGSTSTNHKRFDKPEEMGIEEDIIRKHTTPAYRAPEMWDLFRRDVISEKVDIWALGCLLFRVCYFKSAFDGESKLQVLNGNYRIPELPKYSSSVTDLIKDMLQASPEDRPDITQVWFRVNEMLPPNLQKSLPDRPPEIQLTETREGLSRPSSKTSPMPRRNPPPPPSSGGTTRNPQPSGTSNVGGGGGPLGAFWSTQHAKSSGVEDGGPKFDEPASSASKHERNRPEPQTHTEKSSLVKEEKKESHVTPTKMHEKSPVGLTETRSKDFEIKLFNSEHGDGKLKVSTSGSAPSFKDEIFNTFVAEFDTNKFSGGISNNKMGKEELLEAEVVRLKQELRQANLEKSEISSKFEKLSAICRSQRQELQELKQALAARTPSPSKDALKVQTSPVTRSSSSPRQREKTEGRIQAQGMPGRHSQGSEPEPWQAFAEDLKEQQSVPQDNTPKSVRTRNGHQTNQSAQAAPNLGAWGFETDRFTAVPAANSQLSRTIGKGGHPARFGESNIEKNPPSQPAGWAGF